MLRQLVVSFSLAALLAGCVSAPTSREAAIQEVQSRPLAFADYPQGGNTYLSFSQAHGFQVNYLAANGRAWLWYPGNSAVVPEVWRVDLARNAICWTHPKNSYNPVIKRAGGNELCAPLDLSRRTIVSSLAGDPFKLASGRVPYRLQRCKAPDTFAFDRKRYRC